MFWFVCLAIFFFLSVSCQVTSDGFVWVYHDCYCDGNHSVDVTRDDIPFDPWIQAPSETWHLFAAIPWGIKMCPECLPFLHTRFNYSTFKKKEKSQMHPRRHFSCSFSISALTLTLQLPWSPYTTQVRTVTSHQWSEIIGLKNSLVLSFADEVRIIVDLHAKKVDDLL